MSAAYIYDISRLRVNVAAALDRAATGVGDVGVTVCYSKSRVLNLIVTVRSAHAGDRTTFSMRSGTDGGCESDSDT